MLRMPRLALMLTLMLAAACSADTVNVESDTESVRGPLPLDESTRYGDVMELVSALAEAGVECVDVRGGDDDRIAGCDLDGGEYTELSLYIEDAAAAQDRLAALSANPVICELPARMAPDLRRVTGFYGEYLRGADWTVLDTSGLHLPQIAREIGRSSSRLCAEATEATGSNTSAAPSGPASTTLVANDAAQTFCDAVMALAINVDLVTAANTDGSHALTPQARQTLQQQITAVVDSAVVGSRDQVDGLAIVAGSIGDSLQRRYADLLFRNVGTLTDRCDAAGLVAIGEE